MRRATILALILSVSSLSAASISASGYLRGPGGTDLVNVAFDPTSDVMTYMHEGGVPRVDNGAIISYGSDELTVTYGGMGYSADTFILNDNGSSSVDALMDLNSNDDLKLPIATGTLRVSVLFEGQFSINEYAGKVFYPGQLTESFQLLGALNDSVYMTGPSYPGSTLETSVVNTMQDTIIVDPANGLRTYKSSGTLDIPFSNGQVPLDLTLHSQFLCYGTANEGSCKLFTGFLNTAEIGGAQVFDTNGVLVQGATITSESGHDYTVPLDTAIIPETSSGLLTALGAIVLVIYIKSVRGGSEIDPNRRGRDRP